MLDRLLLKTIGSRLVAAGDCPHDRLCVHAAGGECVAGSDVLRKRKAQIVAKRIQAETRKPCTAWMEITSGKRWPCAGRVWTVLLPAEHALYDSQRA
ncbi:MAG: hypothetical protein DDT21_00342 [Syntrophomonadaceae bacterium]|nr:hypothetical protein [Bacillota bacterium]